MAEKIKKFFSKAKSNSHFKHAGPGRKLNDDSSSSSKQPVVTKAPQRRENMSEESRLAAQAALMRLNEKQKDKPEFNTSLAAIKARVKKELELERKQAEKAQQQTLVSSNPTEVNLELSPHLAVTGAYFTCPFISEEVLSKEEWVTKMREFLYAQLPEEEGLTSVLIIYSCNPSREKIAACVETLSKYLENIIANPEEQKYQKIRMLNKVFCEKVQSIEGSLEFLKATGFEEQMIPNAENGVEEKYLVFNKTKLESLEDLRTLMDALRSAEPIKLELDRNKQVLLPSQAATKTDLPPDFFSISPEEIKKEQKLKAEVMEKSLMLRTKAMREKDELKELRRYKYALIRIRFPDGILLQGTFSVYNKFEDVFNFVNENLEHTNLPFILISPDGIKLTVDEDSDKTLLDLRLIPATILTFMWDSSILDDIQRSEQRDVYLKPDVMLLISQM